MHKTRVAVIGAGQFGQNHIRVAAQSPDADLVAVVDCDSARAREAAAKFTCLALTAHAELAGRVDAAIVATPTVTHAAIGCDLMAAGIDVLVEKPIAPDLGSADRLISSAHLHQCILQIGHLERFNPAVIALEQLARIPLFYEIHRLSVFTPRSLDVDVVLDLMIHDLDIVLSLARSPLAEVRAAGVSVLSPKADIANVRLQFEDGCVANLTASRVSTEKVRKLRLFQPREYISVDYTRQELMRICVSDDRKIAFSPTPVTKGEPLQLQFAAFLDSVRTRRAPKLNGERARRTLEAALAIVDKIEEHTEVVARSLATEWKL